MRRWKSKGTYRGVSEITVQKIYGFRRSNNLFYFANFKQLQFVDSENVYEKIILHAIWLLSHWATIPGNTVADTFDLASYWHVGGEQVRTSHSQLAAEGIRSADRHIFPASLFLPPDACASYEGAWLQPLLMLMLLQLLQWHQVGLLAYFWTVSFENRSFYTLRLSTDTWLLTRGNVFSIRSC